VTGTRRLGETTWTEISDRLTVVIPVGSLEQHGPHLPLDTDARIAAVVARRAVEGEASAIVAPPVAYGASGEHEGFPGTISMGHAALRAVLVEIGRSAGRWAARIVFVNGHGGNLPTVPEAVRQLRAEGRDAAWFGCAVPGGDAHAGFTETSMMLALDPALVRMEAAVVGNTASLQELLPVLTREGTVAASPNGVLGDPTGADAEQGGLMLDAIVERLRERLVRWQPDERGHLV